jgi:hypothetical protein
MAGKIESRRRVRLLCRPPIRAEIEEQREKREKGSKCTKIRRQIRNDYSQSQIAVRVCAGCMYNHPLDECYSRIYCRPVGQHRMVNTLNTLRGQPRTYNALQWLHCTGNSHKASRAGPGERKAPSRGPNRDGRGRTRQEGSLPSVWIYVRTLFAGVCKEMARPP